MIETISKCYLGLLISLLIAATAQAQPSTTYPALLSVDRLTTDEDMPSNEVHKIYKDRTGYMWFLTSRGLVKYYAHDFFIYKHQINNPNSLTHEETNDMLESDDGVFWIGTKFGLNRLNTRSGKFQHYTNDPSNPSSLSDNHITAMLKDRNGKMWISTALGGLNSFDPGTGEFQSYRHDPDNPGSLDSDRITKLALDPSGKIWIGMLDSRSIDLFDPVAETFKHFSGVNPNERHPDVICIYVDKSGLVWYGSWGAGLYCYNPADGTCRNYRNDPSDPHSISSDILHCICQDDKGRLWIGTRHKGLCIFDPETEQFHPVKLVWKIDPNATIDTVLDIFWDKQGILWMATLGDGVCRFDSNQEQIQYFKNNPKDSNTLSENQVYALDTGPDGSIWIGTNGGGLDRYDPQTGRFTHYLGDPGDPSRLDSKTVISLLHDRKGNLWIGSWDNENAPFCRYDYESGEFRCYPSNPRTPSNFYGSVARTICEDYTGTLWIASEGAGLVFFDPLSETFQYYKRGEKGLLIATYHRIFEDRSNRLWIATDRGLQYYNRSDDRFEMFHLDSKSPVSLPECDCLTLFEDSKENLWIGTDKGLFKLNPARTDLKLLTLEDGLADKVVKAVLEDESGFLWFSLDNGKVSRYDPVSGEILNFDKSDGLQNLQFTSNCYAKGKQGELYFGGMNGFNCIWPNQIVSNEYIPPVVITSFEVMGASYPYAERVARQQGIVLNYLQNFISFEFAALNYTRSQKNQYRYRLLPLEKEWNKSRERRYARYTALQPGNYQLQVTGSNNDAVWNEEGVTIPIYIKPPFWKTGWFQFAVAGAILLWIYSRYRHLQNQKKRLEAEVKKQTKALSEANAHLEKMSMQDGLTRLSNRRCFDGHIQTEWQRGIRFKTCLSLLFFDVDHFKKYNDFYGHVTGDECLKQIAEVLRESVNRPGDLAARYGGEEFVIVLTDAHSDNAVLFAERIREGIEQLNIPHESSPLSGNVTVSIGVASAVPSRDSNVDELIQAADDALYQSKSNGRNCVTLTGFPERT